MANVIFAGQRIGAIVLPLMLFHQIQLMVCAWLARRYAEQKKRDAADSDSALCALRPAIALNSASATRRDRRQGPVSARAARESP